MRGRIGFRAKAAMATMSFYEAATPTNLDYRAIAYNGSNLWVAVNADNQANKRLITSPDGVDWTERNGQAWPWVDVVWSGAKFIAVSQQTTDNNKTMNSSDGVTWTLRATTTQTFISLTPLITVKPNGGAVVWPDSAYSGRYSTDHGDTWGNTGGSGVPLSWGAYMPNIDRHVRGRSGVQEGVISSNANGTAFPITDSWPGVGSNAKGRAFYYNGYLYVPGQSGSIRLVRSANGSTWTTESNQMFIPNLPDRIWRCGFGRANKIYLLANTGHLAETEDLTVTNREWVWTESQPFGNYSWKDIKYDSVADVAIAVGQGRIGRILF